ncbi:MAG TPA: ATP-binding protein [Alphaproteobacteria bacterium]
MVTGSIDHATLARVLGGVDEAYALLDPSDRLIYCNERYRRLAGPRADRIVPGIAYTEAARLIGEAGIYVDSRNNLEEALRRRLERHRSGAPPVDHRCADGRWVRVKEYLYPDGHVLIMISDITAEREALAARADSEARFRDFAETASDWFWETGPDHCFTYMSESLSKFGIDPKSRIGKRRVALASDQEKEDTAKWRAHMQTLDAHEPFRDFRYLMHAPGETPRYITVSGKPFFDEKGRFKGYRGSAREITEEVLVERKLIEALNAAETANRAKSVFLANMSHELRTPLNAIIGFASIMRQGIFGPIGNPKYREYVEDIQRSGEHLLQLINDILDLSKVEAGKMPLVESDVFLPDLAEEQLRVVRPKAESKRLQVTVEVDPPFPVIRADVRQVRQMLLNLLSNAVKFTDPGGSITVRCRLDDTGAATISVRDTGIGISQSDLAKVGTRFFQVDGSFQRRTEGTGLGLALTREMAKMHGGSLNIESELGVGTTVTISFPPDRIVTPQAVTRERRSRGAI